MLTIESAVPWLGGHVIYPPNWDPLRVKGDTGMLGHVVKLGLSGLCGL